MWCGARSFGRPSVISSLKCFVRPANHSRSFILGPTSVVRATELCCSPGVPKRAILPSTPILVRLSSPISSQLSWRFSSTGPVEDGKEQPKLSLYQRFKAMYKDYWYVLIPVHVVTSCFWFGAFFYAARSGFDIAGAIEFLGLGEETMDKIRHSAGSTAGHVTLAYLLYKIFTPLRYTVTLGGTTYSIKFLTARGLLKKMPKKEELKQMYADRKDQLKDRKDNLTKEFVGKFSSTKKNMCDDATLRGLALKPLGGAGLNQPLRVLKPPIPAMATAQRGLQDGKKPRE